ncbi:hypothetical protein [Nocardia caishijiensis]|uniref:hypothetical protein n=1 Tax=Nocardia caishijiensis TaxID=184756 RepID=UPI000ACDF8AC|nr:hypothetical protein [Nocardia caishijiensis]
MAPIKVDPQVYYEAAKSMYAGLAELKSGVADVLNPQMVGTDGMGGNDQVSSAWNTEYYSKSECFIDTVVAYGRALHTVGRMFDLAGFNWQVANYDADVESRTGERPSMQYASSDAGWARDNIKIPDSLPPPFTTPNRGLTTTPIELRDDILSVFRSAGTDVTDGDTDALRKAAAAWTAFAEHSACLAAPGNLQQLSDSLGSLQAPETQDVVDILTTIKTAVVGIRSAACGFSSGIADFSSAVADFRSKLVAATPGAFPGTLEGMAVAPVTATASAQAVDIRAAVDFDASEITSAATTLSNSIAGHRVYDLGQRPNFPDTEQLAGIKTSLEEIANSPIDEIANRGSWKSGVVKCTLNPEGQRDYGNANANMREWVDDAVLYGNQAGVDPRVVLAILYQEGGDRAESALQESASWGYDAFRYVTTRPREVTDGYGNSLGITNMKEETFNKLKEKYPEEFAGKQWALVADDDSLAIKAAAFNLKRIQEELGGKAPDGLQENYTRDEYLAAGYNSETKFLDTYIPNEEFGPAAKDYINRFDISRQIASDMIDGVYTCK